MVKQAGENLPSKDIPKALKTPESSDTRWGQEACAILRKPVCSTGHLLVACGRSRMWADTALSLDSCLSSPAGGPPYLLSPFPFPAVSGLCESAVTIVSTWSARPLISTRLSPTPFARLSRILFLCFIFIHNLVQLAPWPPVPLRLLSELAEWHGFLSGIKIVCVRVFLVDSSP